MADTDSFSTLEIIGMTLVGESESLGTQGMTETACVIQNRMNANLGWLGGQKARNVCLQKEQFDCWWPQSNNEDRQRILEIGQNIPLYSPYVTALSIASNLLAGTLVDCTNSSVSYFDPSPDGPPSWSIGKQPCYVNEPRQYYDLAAVT
jgi:Cell Wall Hydrolase